MVYPLRRGRLEPVHLTLVQRMGNKKVTLVDNLDMYGIPPMELAQTMQRVAAASSTGTIELLLVFGEYQVYTKNVHRRAVCLNA